MYIYTAYFLYEIILTLITLFLSGDPISFMRENLEIKKLMKIRK